MAPRSLNDEAARAKTTGHPFSAAAVKDGADMVILSSDKMLLYISKGLLHFASPFFRHLLDNAKPDYSYDSLSLLQLHEPEETLRWIFLFISPTEAVPPLKTAKQLEGVMLAAEKYLNESLVEKILSLAMISPAVKAEPLHCYCIAMHHQWTRLCAPAARSWLALPIDAGIMENMGEVLLRLRANDLMPLILYRQECFLTINTMAQRLLSSSLPVPSYREGSCKTIVKHGDRHMHPWFANYLSALEWQLAITPAPDTLQDSTMILRVREEMCMPTCSCIFNVQMTMEWLHTSLAKVKSQLSSLIDNIPFSHELEYPTVPSYTGIPCPTAPFDSSAIHEGADIIIKSLPNTLFYTSKGLLSFASPLLRSRFDDGDANDAMHEGLPLIIMNHPAHALRWILLLLSPTESPPPLHTASEIEDVVIVGEKYLNSQLQEKMWSTVYSNSSGIQPEPFKMYCIAAQHGWKHLQKLAARRTLSVPWSLEPSSALFSTTGHDIMSLVLYRHLCRVAIGRVLRSNNSFLTAWLGSHRMERGTLLRSHFYCPDRMSPLFRHFLARIEARLGQRPCPDFLTVSCGEVQDTIEAIQSNSFVCRCPNFYDYSSTDDKVLWFKACIPILRDRLSRAINAVPLDPIQVPLDPTGTKDSPTTLVGWILGFLGY